MTARSFDDWITKEIRSICNKLDADMFMSASTRQSYLIKIKELIAKRDTVRKTLEKAIDNEEDNE